MEFDDSSEESIQHLKMPREPRPSLHKAQSQFKNVMPEALAALEEVIKLVHAAQIPLASGVFGIAFELIRCINVSRL